MITGKGKTTDTDMGLRALTRGVKKMDGAMVEAGIFEGEASPGEGGITMAKLGAIHEYGTETIPERSWMRSTDSENRREYQGWVDAVYVKAMKGSISLLSELTAVGERIASDFRRKITSLRTPPNAPSTVARKGSSNPLIDTGAMRQSVRGRGRL